MAATSVTWCDATTQVLSKSVHCWASYSISNIFQYGGRPPSWILKIFIFGHVTAIGFKIYCSILNFIKIGSRVRSPDAHNCWMFNARLLGNNHYHGNRIIAAMSGRRWDATTQVSSKSVHWWASYSISNMFHYVAVRHLEFYKFSPLITWLPLSSKFAALHQISSKLDHAFGIQTPITAECSMRGC